MSSSSPLNYAGDISVQDAWDRLKVGARLVDVRTMAEWNFVGLPDLSDIDSQVACVEWQSFPSGAPNPGFVAQVATELGPDRAAPVLLLCRSGARSRAAAIALTQAGYAQAFNIAGGFEGDTDGHGHRGQRNGWKADGFPWRQG